MSVEAGRVAIVTGSTSGIGAEIVRRLGEAGASVAVAGSAYTYSRAVLGEIFAWIIGWDLLLIAPRLTRGFFTDKTA